MRQSGFSLSEVLIGLLLASFISTLLMQLYVANKRQYSVMQKKLESGFDVQWISDLLSDSIRRAGFTPCLGIDHLKVVNRSTLIQPVRGLETGVMPQPFIAVKRMSEHFSTLLAIPDQRHLLITSAHHLQKQQLIILADCTHAEIHRLIKIEHTEQGTLLTLDSDLFFNYPELSYVGAWLDERWFIQKNSRGLLSLYYRLTRSEELSPLIHSIQVQQKSIHHRHALDIALGLDKGQEQHLFVMVRGS